MSVLATTDPEALDMPLDALLAGMATLGRLGFLTLGQTSEGAWQAAHKKPGSDGFQIGIDEEVFPAILKALRPVPGETWLDVLEDDGLENVL